MNNTPHVGIIMGSQSDWDCVKHCRNVLKELQVSFEVRIISAHRTPDLMYEYAKSAEDRGIRVIIAAAGGAAHLPGMTASLTHLPVLGIPVESHSLKGMDSLLSIAQMPGEIPVGTLAIGKAGAVNAGILAARILAITDPSLRSRLKERMDHIRNTISETKSKHEQLWDSCQE